VLGDTPQDTSFKPCRSEVRIGAGCVIREGVTVHRGTKPDSVTEVGPGCWLMAFSHLAHNVNLGERVMVVNGALLAGYVTVGDRAFISGNCGIHQFCRIGRLAMLGGNCSVTKDVPPFGLLESGSLNGLVGLNVVGMRRAGLTETQRSVVKQAFKVLFRSGLNFTQATAALREAVQDPLAEELCAFVETSARGVCAWDA
jgi:UDP-N-acetylglucosamine acyltransferase